MVCLFTRIMKNVLITGWKEFTLTYVMPQFCLALTSQSYQKLARYDLTSSVSLLPPYMT